ncbi:hypothetical protein P9D34_15080 [Bacillus swezeyi]|nr:hypothetical protein [Bacillus swezeyi]MEC1261757.1 hypothetical protein [Bacillus swezeyi]MED2926380.1 hypothetical protein [Bacillus swezeyi]MED2943850.1 hypothetical protein [Bacillus swezeyi]MED2966057.1 hypothetical protein [Bacillus swezeyi]MED2978685.1 hypothetical protein [Bacillus swezeyi]
MKCFSKIGESVISKEIKIFDPAVPGRHEGRRMKAAPDARP